ncbi:MAG: hypothetical protein RMJ87_09590 [Cytophagales bacterium]|nr:hypothetical protein [Bernardetiaceae bacterium]MDW8205269.1 hypothetical protein [Cytophagales bacterium]
MRNYITVILFLLPIVGFSQAIPEKIDSTLITVERRIEFDLTNRRIADHRIMPLGTEGLLLFMESEEVLRNMRKEVTIVKYDTALQLQWAQRYLLEPSSNMNIYAWQGEHLFFLIPKTDFRYDILRLNVVNGQLSLIRYDKLVDMEVSHFAVINDVILMGGQVNGDPAVIHYNYKYGKPKILPSLSQLKGQVSRMDVSPEHNAISVIVSSSVRRKASFYYYIYNGEGQLLHKRIIPHEQEYSIVNFRPYFISSSRQLLFGLYSLTSKERSQGVYVADFEGNTKSNIKFYDFAFLKNFFNYMPPRRRERTILRLKDKREEGKIPKLDYHFFARNLLVTPERILFVAESYIPVFMESNMARFNGFQSPPFFNPFVVNTLNPFLLSYNNLFWLDRNMVRPREGNRMPSYYRYKHAIICAFDKSGKLLWDNSFEYKDAEMRQPEELVKIHFDNDHLQMLYYNKDKLYYKHTHKSLPVDTLITTQIPIRAEEKNLISDRENERVSWWYGNRLIMFGKQDLKQHTADNSFGRKRVFYITKATIVQPTNEAKQ